ncbi:FAD-dependent oxidoreductase [Roseovarius sp. LXJ103]|uniref:flavin monoamine oxidase family protein n=1 Tax=Roseovarius carneus TaxID=2853164 RepID=UPI0015E81F93|nr:FAD-dependent oxidoreductase [Roseovarius carneus]MBZ8119747.1 FAD-dependent oxidoreductase [Roseovarius carneus]
MPDQKIIILGAGFCGLGAARALAEVGMPATVIEAKDRIGGRAWTSDLWPDLPVDMGASWIHGVTGNPLTELTETLGIKQFPTSSENAVAFDATGRKIDYIAALEEIETLIEKARDAIDDNDDDMSLKAAVEQSTGWLALSPERRKLLRLALHTSVEHEYSGDWARLSAWYYDDGDDFPGGDAVMQTGYAPLIAHLAEGLDIHLGEPVLRLEPSGDGVRLETTRESYFADKVIMTLPLGVLKSGDIQFGAPLKKKRQKAINRLEMGLLNKCWLRFDAAFWPEGFDWINYLGDWQDDTPGHWTEFTNFSGAAGVPLLVGFNAAASAQTLEKLSDEATAASAMAALRSMFGSAIPDPIGYQISRWQQDPFAQGAYSFQPVGTRSKTRKALFGSDWDDRLFFAGEATSHEYPGTAHGALMTGRAAAALSIT